MKPRADSRPDNTRRPSAPDDRHREHARVRDEASRPDSSKRNEKTIPADRGAREQESMSQGSE
jgi:hypothetical protein